MSAQGPAESPLGEAPCETMEAPPSATEPSVSEYREPLRTRQRPFRCRSCREV